MDIVVFTGDRQTPNSDEFPQTLTPFPEPTDLIYAHPPPATHPPDPADRRPVSPPHKLRPIRCSARSVLGEFPGYAGPAGTLAGKDLPCGEAPMNAGVRASEPVQDGPDTSVGGWETNDVIEDESSSSSDGGLYSLSAKSDGPTTSRERKRKSLWNIQHFVENMVMNVLEKQEQMHLQLIEAIEKMERERASREEAWRQLEIERQKRDEAERAQETSRSLALISFLQLFLGEEVQTPEPIFQHQMEESWVETDMKCDPTNKRWPKAEVKALITLRTTLDHKFRGTGCKGSVWEEISVSMSAMGYNRTAKKCQEKWENINKYFRRVTESGKRRSASSKTCPYFDELDLLYKNGLVNPGVGIGITNSGDADKSERES